jgi:hypothetical protein
MKKTLALLALSAFILAPAAQAWAQEDPSMYAGDAPAEDLGSDLTGLVSLSVGHYNTFGDEKSFDFRAELRPEEEILIENLQPWGGLEITHEGTIFLGGGLLYDWNLVPDWYLTPSFGAGIYSQGDDDVDLEFPIQFRSQIEAAYEFDNDARAGAYLSHMSNLGLDNSNPGAETMGVTVAFPY